MQLRASGIYRMFQLVDGRIDTLTDMLPSVLARFLQLLHEAIVLQGREGEVFDAVVTDEDDRGARIQVRDPAIVTRVVARRVDPGDDIQVKLVNASPTERRVDFERVG